MLSRPVSRPVLPAVTILALLLGAFSVLALPGRVAAQTELLAELSGAEEVPGPGDEDGEGFAWVIVDPEAGEVCAFIDVFNIAPATAAHIHEGAAGVAGGVVVTLPVPDAEGHAEGCVDGLDATLLQAIIDEPGAYYVNVHNADFPAGAIRGQLQVPPPPPIDLFFQLSGDAEVPGPGDPDGSGDGHLSLFVEGGELCVFMLIENIAAATAAHVHEGVAGVAGGIVITLPTPDADGFGDGCVDGLDPVLLQTIVDNPAGYYVNVHNAEYPAGAVRGQLADEPPPPPACEPGELCTGLIGPGTYTYTRFETDVTFTTVSDWLAELDEIPALSLYDPDFAGGLFAWSFTGDVFADPCDFESATTIGTSPADLIGWLADRSFLTTSEPEAVSIGGASGFRIDVSATTLPAECTEPPWVFLFVLPIYGDFHFDANSVGSFVALDVDGETILIVIEHWAEGDPTDFLGRAEGVLNSMVWALDEAPAAPQPSPSASPAPLPDTALPADGVVVPTLAWVLGVALLVSGGCVLARRRA